MKENVVPTLCKPTTEKQSLEEFKEFLKDVPFQVTFKWSIAKPVHIRDLKAEDVGKVVCVKGIIINNSRVSVKIEKAYIRCSLCPKEEIIHVSPGK